MTLEEMSMARLLDLHNSIADKPAGPKTFATRSKMISQILHIAVANSIDLEALLLSQDGEAENGTPGLSQVPTGRDTAAPEISRKRGNGVGELAGHLLLDVAGFPYSTIAEMVNASIPGSAATDKSVRWYASKMRKEGLIVPERRQMGNDHIWISDPEAAKQWLSGVRVGRTRPIE